MIRTQIQIPDMLHRSSKRLADRMEISFSELVRRGLEYQLSVVPHVGDAAEVWSPPEPHVLGGRDPFADPDWRLGIHGQRLKVADDHDTYGSEPGA